MGIVEVWVLVIFVILISFVVLYIMNSSYKILEEDLKNLSLEFSTIVDIEKNIYKVKTVLFLIKNGEIWCELESCETVSLNVVDLESIQISQQLDIFKSIPSKWSITKEI